MKDYKTKVEEFISIEIKHLRSDFSFDQIRRECWRFCLEQSGFIFPLESIPSMIYESMAIYAEIIKRYEKEKK